jgi:predicted metalloenzyme YecM
MKAKDIIGDYQFFIKDLLEQVKSIGIDIEDYCIDHLCYRVSSIEEYAEMKDKLMVISQRYIENIHHDRPIAKLFSRSLFLATGILYP